MNMQYKTILCNFYIENKKLIAPAIDWERVKRLPFKVRLGIAWQLICGSHKMYDVWFERETS